MVKKVTSWVGKFRPEDIIAILILLGGFYLLSQGIDGEVKGLMGVVVGFYFRGLKK